MRSQSGSVLSEFVLTIPVFVFLLTAAFEFSCYLHARLILEDIAYEGARAGSQMAVETLPEGCFADQEMQLVNTGNEALQLVLSRVRYLVAQQHANLSIACQSGAACAAGGREPAIAAEVIKVQSGAGALPCGRSSDHENTFSVRVQGEYIPHFFSWVRLPIDIQKRAYILLNNAPFSTQSNPNPSGACGGVSVSSANAAGLPSITDSSHGNDDQMDEEPDSGDNGGGDIGVGGPLSEGTNTGESIVPPSEVNAMACDSMAI